LNESPNLILLAGPNGAGKTTAAPRLLQGALSVHEFVNADIIAQGISGFNPEAAAIDAGRVMLDRLRRLTSLRVNVAFESTLASRSFAPWIRRLREDGYKFHLYYFWLATPELAIQRVAHRKRLGGHTVPVETIRRRYNAGLKNFFSLYAPIADTWHFYDNMEPVEPRLVAERRYNDPELIADPDLWDKIKQEIRDAGSDDLSGS
jgi:predicted ABC-type ATPase